MNDGGQRPLASLPATGFAERLSAALHRDGDQTGTSRYLARWVFPVLDEPIPHGIVEIRAGTIVGVSPARAGDAPPRGTIDLGNVALVPGFVNAHTHLEFSNLANPLEPARPFTDWIRAIRALRAERHAPPAESIAHGLAESAAAGTTLLGEIATAGWEKPLEGRNRDVFDRTRLPVRAVVFRELLAPTSRGVDSQFAVAQEHVARFEKIAQSSSSRARAGLSPHAPYSVHPELFGKVVSLAEERRLPIAMHLAETEAELELLAAGTGRLAEMLREFGFPSEALSARRTKPRDYLGALARCARALVVHGNYLSDNELDFIAAHSSLTLVYCPRTHDYFGHAAHPWRKLLARGGRVALGTDSRASNPDLSLWNELLFLRERHPEVDPRDLLALGTLRGAEALGERDRGAIIAGRAAEMAVIALPAEAADPWESLFAPASFVVGTIG